MKAHPTTLVLPVFALILRICAVNRAHDLFDRSKPSGPGRLFGGCSSFVSRQAFVVDRERLRSGRGLWKSANCDFQMDFWIPCHTVDFSSCVRVPASCSKISQLSKQLFMRLHMSVHAGHSWAPEPEPLFADRRIASAFTEHSVQCFRMSQKHRAFP